MNNEVVVLLRDGSMILGNKDFIRPSKIIDGYVDPQEAGQMIFSEVLGGWVYTDITNPNFN